MDFLERRANLNKKEETDGLPLGVINFNFKSKKSKKKKP